jgi:hypothetical protein
LVGVRQRAANVTGTLVDALVTLLANALPPE